MSGRLCSAPAKGGRAGAGGRLSTFGRRERAARVGSFGDKATHLPNAVEMGARRVPSALTSPPVGRVPNRPTPGLN